MSMKVKVSKLFVLLFIGVFLLSAVNMVNALGVTATIPVGRAPMGAAYDSAKGEIFVGNAVISDSPNYAVVANVPEAFGAIVYDSGKGEIFGAGPSGIDVISDSSSTSTPATSTVTSPSPTVPEFSSTALISVAAAMVVVSLCAVAVTARTRRKLRK